MDLVRLAHLSKFDPLTWTIDSEFNDNDSFLENAAEEWDFDVDEEGEAELEGQEKVELDLSNAREDLASAMKQKDDLDVASHQGPSRATNFEQSEGASTLNSVGAGEIARNHKERALKNVELLTKNVALEDEVEKMRLEMQQLRNALAAGKPLEDMEVDVSQKAQQPAVIFATPANNADKTADSRKTTDPGGGEVV